MSNVGSNRLKVAYMVLEKIFIRIHQLEDAAIVGQLVDEIFEKAKVQVQKETPVDKGVVL